MAIDHFIDDILDTLDEGVYISDRNGTTLKVNKTYEKLTGLKVEKLIGRNVNDLQKEGTYSVVLNPYIVKTKKSKTLIQTTSKGYNVILNGHPILGPSGEVVLVVTFVRDITALSRLKEKLEAQLQLIETYTNAQTQVARETSQLVMESKVMLDLLEKVNRIAKTDVTVLLRGETGVGKELFARMLHRCSPRVKQPFFKVDCTSIPENLVESELFGYETGAFSGAGRKGKPGLVEMAHKGTLFLDEIGEMPRPVQAKLLRLLQDKEIIRVGGTVTKKVDVRIVAATHRDLEEAVEVGTFREDLFYRISVAVTKVPPLRARKQDIVLLMNHFLKKFNAKYSKKMVFSKGAKESFQFYRWPGNVREMENLIHNLVVTGSKDSIERYDLPSRLSQTGVESSPRSLKDLVGDFEKKTLEKAMNTHGSITKIAQLFQVDRVTIYRKMKKYSLV